MKKPAFTLIELMAVLLMLALLSALAAVKLATTARPAQMTDVLDQLAYQDQLLREQARRCHRPVELRIDLAAGTVQRSGASLGAADDATAATHPPLRLPEGYRVARLLMPGRDLAGGEAVVNCSGRGLTPTYALSIEGPDGKRQWLLFAGLTGQSVRMQDDANVQDIFNWLSAR